MPQYHHTYLYVKNPADVIQKVSVVRDVVIPAVFGPITQVHNLTSPHGIDYLFEVTSKLRSQVYAVNYQNNVKHNDSISGRWAVTSTDCDLRWMCSFLLALQEHQWYLLQKGPVARCDDVMYDRQGLEKVLHLKLPQEPILNVKQRRAATHKSIILPNPEQEQETVDADDFA